MRTNQDLFDYAKTLARIEVIDYDYRNLSGWYRDRRVRDMDRKQVMRRYGWMHEKPLQRGRSANGRLTVTDTGFNYVTVQYTATEIWGAVLSYMESL